MIGFEILSQWFSALPGRGNKDGRLASRAIRGRRLKLRDGTSPWRCLATPSLRTRRNIVDLRRADTSVFRNILARRSPAARYHDASATEIPSMLTPPDTQPREHSHQPETRWWRGNVVSDFSCLSGRVIGLRNGAVKLHSGRCSRCVAGWSRKADTEPGPVRDGCRLRARRRSSAGRGRWQVPDHPCVFVYGVQCTSPVESRMRRPRGRG